MTRQAEHLTIAVNNEPVICAPRGAFLDSAEVRPVLPNHFQTWYERERRRIASRLARWLGFTSGPFPISTALRLAVRLSLRGTELRRSWVAFSVVEEPFLRERRLPDAEILAGLVDGAIRFAFSDNEPPLATATSLTLVPCDQMSPLGFYPQRGEASRQIALTPRDG